MVNKIVRRALAFNMTRSVKSKNADKGRNAKRILKPTKANLLKWKSNPSLYDMKGVDTRKRDSTIKKSQLIDNQIKTLEKRVKTLRKNLREGKFSTLGGAKKFLMSKRGRDSTPLVKSRINELIKFQDKISQLKDKQKTLFNF